MGGGGGVSYFRWAVKRFVCLFVLFFSLLRFLSGFAEGETVFDTQRILLHNNEVRQVIDETLIPNKLENLMENKVEKRGCV